MKSNSDRNKSRRMTPWEGREHLTPTQEFIANTHKEHYMQRHPALSETGEVEMINSYIPKRCPYCGGELFRRNGHSKIGVQRDTSV